MTTIKDCDRKALDEIFNKSFWQTRGLRDDGPFLDMLATHRELGAREENAAVVNYLFARGFTDAAHAIDHGKHLK